jgi:broad specificity phosphatase PhoE
MRNKLQWRDRTGFSPAFFLSLRCWHSLLANLIAVKHLIIDSGLLDRFRWPAKAPGEPFCMPTHLILMSHAPTKAMRTASFPGDEPLDPPVPSMPEARAEIEKLGRINYALIGPEQRAAQTASALQLKVDFTVDSALRDCDYGRWTGRRINDVQAEEPEAIASWITSPEATPHGGESVADLLERVAQWLDDQGRVGARVLAVTHPTVIRAAILHAIEAPARSFWRINVEPLSIIDLRGNKGRWTLRSLAVR